MEKENDIQNSICQYLQLKHYFFWRQNTAPSVQTTGGQWTFRRMGKYALKGVPDIILIQKGGKVIFLEVKTSIGILSDSQKEFYKKCVLIGADYHIVKSIDDIVKIGL